MELTLVEVLGGDGEHRVLDVLVLLHLGLVECLVEVRRVVVLVGDSDADELGNCGSRARNRGERKKIHRQSADSVLRPISIPLNVIAWNHLFMF